MSGDLYVPGPLHPDLFDGETPIMERFEGKVFKADVRIVDFKTWRRRVLVLAADEDEAQDAVTWMLRSEGSVRAEAEILIDAIAEAPIDSVATGPSGILVLRRRAAMLVSMREAIAHMDAAAMRAAKRSAA